MPQKNLTTKQIAFVRGVADGLGIEAAVKQAGYATSSITTRSLMGNKKVQIAIQAEREKFEKANLMTKKKVMDGFLDAINQARMLADPTAQIQGWNSIAKMCGYFEPTRHRIEVDVKGKVIVERLQQLSDVELLKLADGDSSVIEGEIVTSDE